MRLTTIILTLLLATPAQAEGDRCWLISSEAAASIAAGAITTTELEATPGGVRPSAMTPTPTHLKIGLDLVDASNGVTSVVLSFTGAEVTAGTFRTVSEGGGGIRTIALQRDWNPTVGGKNWLTVPIPWHSPYFMITATPIGYGAGDTLAMEVYGCTMQHQGLPGEKVACALAAGGATIVDCSAAAAYSAQLKANTDYAVQGFGGEPYFTQAIAGSGVDADANDMRLPELSWGLFSTSNGARYFTCLGTADSSVIRYQECQ